MSVSSGIKKTQAISEIRGVILKEFPRMAFMMDLDKSSRCSESNDIMDKMVIHYNMDINGEKNFNENRVRAIVRDYIHTNMIRLPYSMQHVTTVGFKMKNNYSKMPPNQLFVNTVVENFKNSGMDSESFIKSLEILVKSSNTVKNAIDYKAVISEISGT